MTKNSTRPWLVHALASASSALLAASASNRSEFLFEAGVFKLLENPSLRLRFQFDEGDGLGQPLGLWPCMPQRHELFILTAGRIRPKHAPDMCLGESNDPDSWSIIATWRCDTLSVEHFTMTIDGRIRPEGRRHVCLYLPEGWIEPLMHTCTESATNEVFELADGLLRIKSHPDYHLSVDGGHLGVPGSVVMGACQAQTHEIFEFTKEYRLRLMKRKDRCIKAERGLEVGGRLILHHCPAERPTRNEQFRYDPSSGAILALQKQTLGFSVKQANTLAGGEIVLWPLSAGREL